ncbi:Mitochondrial intermembrane space cysteine motif-containing protein MIX17 [Hondaea fermentalgiana]|uniref:Mitochondrial intermembrane space cysteine motif-containing protein MIX17 n=1 Tax=Hondaea fermentalgiana TaxID=2315210 RepID=A0A2R5GTN9_9STRA|nr:Mitochondrial intermembrane space cysteine motif-containing protein MIX17 [Hondaea fermentalgiana]|eukprot:GBG32013.1 Mitochondrial intermembrane space cysteine motif-containing protein MIX17 [Hondaea fermentalgiana]
MNSGGMVAQGMALGVGSSMGHHAVNGAMNMFSGSGDDKEAAPQQQAAPQQAYPQVPAQNYNLDAGDACAVDQKQLYQCLQEQNNNAAACDFYFQALRACQENKQYQ